MKKYSTDERERKVFAVMMGLVLLIIIVWGALELGEAKSEQGWQPDVVYPMANAHISWEQTYHGGAWNE